ncbi:MAG: ATP-dependent DNA helicase [Proteobacteria bacterium]|nr:ATP-dependent DNA helicase [Pseudomonadota bacterium]
MPDAPALAAGLGHAGWAQGDTAQALGHDEAAKRLRDGAAPIVCHMPATARRLGAESFRAFDLLELYAFARPARFCVPTPRGLAAALDLDPPGADPAEEAVVLLRAAEALMAELANPDGEEDSAALAEIARPMAEGGWPWGEFVMAALEHAAQGEVRPDAPGLAVWRRLPEWSEYAPEPTPGDRPVDPADARRRLAELLGADAEARPQQADYAAAVTPAFAPRAHPGAPNMVIAEAGTGVGKTLGYIAPASLWAERNQGPVWISTYTRNLQHQIDGELDRLFPQREEKARKVVIRKGRENYLCLLNLEEAVGGARMRARSAVAVGLMARWAGATRDGDMVGGDFPTWLAGILGRAQTFGLADSRGECIYSACSHYHKCFIERSVRRARRAEIVVANHALVMIQAALGGVDDSNVPQRYVFDEAHHIFDAADSAFSSHLSGMEMAELRRWILGAEGRRGSRARGLRRRAGDLALDDAASLEAIDEAERAARVLPGVGWLQRLETESADGAAEAFLARLRQQVYARAPHANNPYSIECEAIEPVEGLIEEAAALNKALENLAGPLRGLAKRLAARLEDEAADLDTATRQRIEAVCRGLLRRGDLQLGSWRDMLTALAAETPAAFVDWFAVERMQGQDRDVGMHRHWVDPTIPFANEVGSRAQGLLATSATLRDGTDDPESNWLAAEARTGAIHLPDPPTRAAVASPFDYAAHTRVVVVGDVRKDDLGQVAGAYRALFEAAGGGALGLFTAIARLRAVHTRIAEPLERAGLTLLAQHIDGLDVSTLIEIFRAERDHCLLGTDAVRDGVDVPGPSLRLIVFDRVPWPRPDILHRARKAQFGGRAYDDMLTRLRLKQAFGRLVRRADDKGVFVMLDPMMPSRLAGAFPEGVEVQRTGLKEAVGIVGDLLAEHR